MQMPGKLAGTQSIDRAIELLKLVAAHEKSGLGLSELARKALLTRPTTHRVLRALEREHLLEFEPATGAYHLGMETFLLGILASERYGIHRAALPTLVRLAQKTGDTCFLSAQLGWHAVCLHREEGAFPIRTHALVAGERHPLGVGSGSMAILAALEDADVETCLKENTKELAARFPNYTPSLIRKQVAETRKRGFSFNPGLLLAGSWGVGVAIINDRGRCEGALSIGGIEGRFGERRRTELAKLLQREAQTLGKRLRPDGQRSSSAKKRQARKSRM